MPVDPELIKNILIRDFNYFNSRGTYIDEKNDPLSAHLFAINGSRWRSVRSKVSTTFSSGKLKMLFPTLETVADKLVNVLEEKISEPVEMKELMAQYTTDVIGSCIFGIETDSLKNPKDELRKCGKRYFKIQSLEDMMRNIGIFSYPKLMKILRIKFAPKDIDTYFRKIVKDVVEFREANKVERKDLIQLLLQLKNKDASDDDDFSFSLNDITAQCFSFFLAGFETSSSTLTFLFYEIAKRPEIQEKIRKEIMNTNNGKVDYNALWELTYLDQVIAETLRMHPIVPVLNRECCQDYPIPKGNYTIKKGQKVYIPVIGLHHDPDYYPNPEKFDPDRFGPESKSQETLTYFPFGDGPRYCVGKRFAQMQIKLAVASILMKFSLSLNPKTVEPVVYDTENVVCLSPKEKLLINVVKV